MLVINTALHSNLNSSIAIALNVPIQILHLPGGKENSKSLKLLRNSEAKHPRCPASMEKKLHSLLLLAANSQTPVSCKGNV